MSLDLTIVRECFWGDILYGSATDLATCDTPCAGNSKQLCGGSDRLIVYQDNDWVDPSIEILEQTLQEFESVCKDIADIIQDWYEEVENAGSSRLFRRKNLSGRDPYAYQRALATRQVLFSEKPNYSMNNFS
jgi:hypothetical protein